MLIKNCFATAEAMDRHLENAEMYEMPEGPMASRVAKLRRKRGSKQRSLAMEAHLRKLEEHKERKRREGKV